MLIDSKVTQLVPSFNNSLHENEHFAVAGRNPELTFIQKQGFFIPRKVAIITDANTAVDFYLHGNHNR